MGRKRDTVEDCAVARAATPKTVSVVESILIDSSVCLSIM